MKGPSHGLSDRSKSDKNKGSSNFIRQHTTRLALPTGDNEYTYNPEDNIIDKQKKTLQRQLNLSDIIARNPVLIGADPKILSVNQQPLFEILETKSMRKDKHFKSDA
mmetsp:Transcript_18523/g.28443  ORF Transcript_18523/g.28443 Transcript_18523/m.28443 type:complete len:107 (-) Transcript_18523:1667-1987(-)|eukprot:CAMPEP_0170512748 /NCGR_PEP_ID=MMETSP0208-20121228/67019_1 /TAXON_ID=197538 /ORGANISM="Strombidium inclinatum, Strain S3" /LENGTH=106 /DNA_ID=CAMNT_0010796409 /DNA_START=604 /DNA_END=924 /DNA_ORIENTATION=-